MMEPHVMGRLWNADIAKHYGGVVRSERGHVPPLEQGEGHRRRRRRRARGVLLESAGDDRRGFGRRRHRGDGAGPLRGLGRPGGSRGRRQGGCAVSRRGPAAVEPGSVYAIGDIAAFPLKLTGETVRLEHVKHARDSAAYVGDLIAGKTPAEYDPTPYFYSARLRTSRHRTRRQLGLLRRSNRR